MKSDPVAEHLETRTEAEIEWHVRFLAGTRARLMRRAVTPCRPELTAEQLDMACLRAERELATYRLALMLIEAMPVAERAQRKERASGCVTSWSAVRAPRERPEYAVGRVPT
jgi:hypothetical protein